MTVGVVGPLRLDAMAHGGSCVARLDDGRVVFVRFGIPGESVRVRLLDTSHASWWQGEVAEVIRASPDRIEPVCPVAGICGGCDFQHVRLDVQRALKAGVVNELMGRLAGLRTCVATEPVAGDRDGLAWRRRQRYLVSDGRCGLRAWRSHRFVATPPGGCPLASPDLPGEARLAGLAVRHGADQIAVAVDDTGQTSVWAGTHLIDGVPTLRMRVHDRGFDLPGDGFWQVHPGAATAFADAVLEMLRPVPGETAWDLYCGVGLFAGALAASGATVRGIESSPGATILARRNVPEARFDSGRVERVLTNWPDRVDLVVLDPPRRGAGRAVVEQIVARRPRAVAYLACDPASLARDLAHFAEGDYRLAGLRVFDTFPMTHHIECIAHLALP